MNRRARRLTPIQRWARMVRLPVDADDCWEWLGCKGFNGHGRFSYDGRLGMAHRFGYESFIAPIPEEEELDHFRMNPGPRHALCTRACVNPSHVEPVSTRENVLRGRGITAQNYRKTHCLRGHQYTSRSAGRRRCQVCENLYSRSWKANNRQKVNASDRRRRTTIQGAQTNACRNARRRMARKAKHRGSQA